MKQNLPEYIVLSESCNTISIFILNQFHQSNNATLQKMPQPHFWLIFYHFWSFFAQKGSFSNKSEPAMQVSEKTN